MEHVALYVNDLERAKDFFVKYFGAKLNDGYHNQKSPFFCSMKGSKVLSALADHMDLQGDCLTEQIQPCKGFHYLIGNFVPMR